ncbi:MAG: c-type cytochrome [Acidobacteria bacterium]|nr:c-type cytochrome [Acidobacteriota bacterium]
MHCLLALLVLPPAHAAELADPGRGAAILDQQHCTSCHKFDRQWRSGTIARLFHDRLTPARLVGAVWSHAPLMWSAISASGEPVPVLTTGQAADVIAWFSTAGYFEPIGDGRNGARLFQTKGCAVCHPANGSASEASAVSSWSSPAYLFDFIRAMWQHAPWMRQAMERKRMPWLSLSANEMRDLLAYAVSLSARMNPAQPFHAGEPAAGKSLYLSKGCTSCHARLLTGNRVSGHSLTEIAAIMWNHAPMMSTAAGPLSLEQVANLIAYLWSVRYFEDTGNGKRGERIFAARHCDVCHASPPSASLAAMLAALWKHPPAVIGELREKRLGWPKFMENEMADLIAYLQTRTRPDADRGSALVK